MTSIEPGQSLLFQVSFLLLFPLEKTGIGVTTADFYDEKLRSFRSPRLVERANVMGIKVLPADFGTFDVFTEKVAQLIDG